MSVAFRQCVKVRLVKKFADEVDGVDLRGHSVGDALDLPPRQAGLLLAEQWALPERRERDRLTKLLRREDDYSREDL